MVKVRQPDWSRIIHHPCIIVILGSKRSGKTGLACVILDYLHKLYAGYLKYYVIGSRRVRRAFPKWIRSLPPRQLSRLDKLTDSVILGDDIHLYAHAREWYNEPNKVLDVFQRESGHNDQTYIYTTQQSIVIDKNLLSMVDVLFIKQPSLLQTAFARREVAKTMEFVEAEYKKLEKSSDKINIQKYVYCLTHTGEYMLGTYDLPKWFNKEISKVYRDSALRQKRLKQYQID